MSTFSIVKKCILHKDKNLVFKNDFSKNKEDVILGLISDYYTWTIVTNFKCG